MKNNKVIKIATIWKKSVSDNDFKCTKCGARLSTNKVEPDKCLLIEQAQERMLVSTPEEEWKSPALCPVCHMTVAYMTKVYAPEDAVGNMGNYQEYLNKTRRL